MASLHTILDNDDLDISKIKELLEKDSSSINEKNPFGETPLVRVLKNEKCSADIVEMFINCGANLNSSDKFGDPALLVAIYHDRDTNILKVLLQKGVDVPHTIKFQNSNRKCLEEYLRSYDDCSLEIFNLFLQNGLNVSRWDNNGNTILISALRFCTNKEIIQALLTKGADPNMHDRQGRYPLCVALSNSHSVDVINMLLNAGSSLNGCMKHRSVLHCATDEPSSALNEDVLKLLLQEGADVRRVDKCRNSLLCFAIPKTGRANDIKLLLKAGAPLDACSIHSSPLLCATDKKSAVINEDMVKLLVGEGACVDVVNYLGLSPLELALKYCNYETEAIELLFNLQTVNIKCAKWNENVLHSALSNYFCKTSTLKFLINNGAQVDKLNSSGNSLMHVAVSVNLDSKSSIISFLLTLNTPINLENGFGETPLEFAVEIGIHSSILQLLLAAGARLNRSVLSQKLAEFGLPGETDSDLLNILKYAFLQNPDFDIGDLIQGHMDYEVLLDFAAKYSREVRRMESKTIRDGRSFREFLNELYLPREIVDDHNQEVNYSNLNELLRILISDEFPLFIDVIITKIGRKLMEKKLQELQVYAVKCPRNIQVILNYYSVCKIAKFLSDDDLLNLILAFHIDDDGDR